MNEKFIGNVLFEAVPLEELRKLDLYIEEHTFRPGEIVFEEGDPGEHVYLVAEGEVRISKRGRAGKQEVLTSESAGGFFGEMALLDGENRSARATAVGITVLGKMGRDSLDRYLSHSSGAARHFARQITEQLRTANSKFIEELVNSERLSLVGTMMSKMVHDFRNPISTIGMVAHYLDSHEDPRFAELGGLTQEAIDSMQDMIQELLDFSKGTARLNLKPIRTGDLIEKLERSIFKKIEGAGIEIRREIEYHGEINVDSHRLMRLLLNIVKNSREAMLHGGILTFRVKRLGTAVKFEVEDTGCGIKPEILERIFEPFVTHGKSAGTGLGMAIAKSVVDAHHGRIWIESEEGQGTCCHIELPLGIRMTDTAPIQLVSPQTATAGAV